MKKGIKLLSGLMAVVIVTAVCFAALCASAQNYEIPEPDVVYDSYSACVPMIFSENITVKFSGDPLLKFPAEQQSI